MRRKLAQNCVITLALYLKNDILNNRAQSRISKSRGACVMADKHLLQYRPSLDNSVKLFSF